MTTRAFDYTVVTVWLFMLVAILLFWSAIGWTAVHFISKWW